MPDQVRDYLIRGADVLAARPGFRLVGREAELKKICGMLMRKHASNVLLVGPGGVGCSSICLGLQAAKDDPTMPFDIISKRLFWLDTDGLFSSGVQSVISAAFERLRRTLLRTANSVLIVDDARDFIDAARNNGSTHLINAIMRDVHNQRFQCILEARDDDLEVVLKCHSNMREIFTMIDVREPTPEALRDIALQVAKALHGHHRIPLSEAAIDAAIELTGKYDLSDMSLSRAQPERTLNLLDRALTAYRQRYHAEPAEIERLRAALSELPGEAGDVASARRAALEAELQAAQRDWAEKHRRLSSLHQAQKAGEELLLALEDELAKEQARQVGAAEEPVERTGFSAKLGQAGFGTKEEARINEEIRTAVRAIADNRSAFEALTEQINQGLELTDTAVTEEFSAISGIPADKLNQDTRLKLLGLEDALKERVYGQDHAVEKLVGAVMMANAGLKEPDKPQGSFMFCGPSGVGKTEIAKSLAWALKDSEKAMLRFDMSEYMEKHAMAKLIGAPPGYEGYEAGGILTNSVRRNPHSIVLFDEVEKAHPDVFNVFLQVLDDGRLTDNRGLTVSFANCIVLMTTNIGQSQFLDDSLSYDEAMAATMDELEESFRPEFLNRFAGRQNIIGFNRLPLKLIEKIAVRELQKVNRRIADGGSEVTIHMAPEAVSALCRDRYNPIHGARGIPGFFAAEVYPRIARKLLSEPDTVDRLTITYTGEQGGVVDLLAEAA
ncbi:MAG: AAA family ATPase [Paracoccaceae bacterium]|nr:AAA family ATPase [Paracoccaceae bacterium]